MWGVELVPELLDQPWPGRFKRALQGGVRQVKNGLGHSGVPIEIISHLDQVCPAFDLA